VDRAGGTVEISNEELYDAITSTDGQNDRFEVRETPAGVRLTRRPPQAV
jgi:hypothetical protein